ncbi:phosphoribosylamine--glycine ligase [Candidatus Woesearchaeota archaeon CG_4_10_14_0_8_um_filter_47_5]|nr:MAG: phosphoribosylamine--glycine ligase [Candidatus Woesearchaeota archaeon CG_4_10_14_0_8_um_filter_47_5]
MNILVIGSGGREHALCWKLAQSPLVQKIYCAPGNGGTSELAENIALDIMDNRALASFAQDNHIDLTIVGPEAPLVNGIVDAFKERNLTIFGPEKKAALLEGSKVFAKKILTSSRVPTARGESFTDPEKAQSFIKHNPWARVVKADGLAAGKGVYVCSTEDEALEAVDDIMVKKIFGAAGTSVLIEEKLVGEEASFLALSDGTDVVPFIPTQDHKPAYNNDQGPNTGGMGAYGPAPVITPQLHKEVMETIMRPTIRAMAAQGTPYTGILYAGLMITKSGPKVLEFNCRFGDPEAQPILMLLESDLVPLLMSCAHNPATASHSSASSSSHNPTTFFKAIPEITFSSHAACCVVLASGGYPGPYEKNKHIAGLEKASALPDAVVFHAGTTRNQDACKKDARKTYAVCTNGGRVLGVTGKGATIAQAVAAAYRAVGLISFEGMHYRTDIGAKALKRRPSRDGINAIQDGP